MNASKFFTLTNYEKIFDSCYWGQFKITDENKTETLKIAKNRNQFALEFDLVKFIDNARPNNAIGLFDHCELYKCKEGYVYIVSPYADNADVLESFGLQKYNKLYEKNALTYLKKFPNKVEFNRFLKAAEQRSKLITSNN